MKQRWMLAAALMGIFTFSCSELYGQNITGSIVGQVADPSGSAIPGAEVTARSTETGVAAQTTTDTYGSYSIPNLLASTYEISVRKDGFQTYTVRGIELLSAQTLRQDIKMQVGAVQQTVEVVGQALLIRTDSQTIGNSVGSRQVADLPLAGRSIDSLMALAPGMVTSGTNPRISGSSYWGGTNFSLNGVAVNDSANSRAQGTSGVSNFVGANFPAPDSLQEFKIESGDQNAEYRNVASVLMVTKQGTNAFHGLAYEFLQNTSLNANTLLLNATGQPRAPSHLNQFGADLGGPLLRNRLFFYGAYRGIRNVFPGTTNLSFPSMAMRNGDFSALCTASSNGICGKGTQLYNPFTGAPFPNNQIPANLITKQATSLLGFLPAPSNLSSPGLPNGSPNYIAPVPNNAGINGVDYRMDGQISSADSINGVFHWSRGSPWFLAAGGYPANYGNNEDNGYTNYTISATETHIFSPTAINEFRAAWVVLSNHHNGQNTDFNPASLFPQLPIRDNGGLPTMTMTGYTGMFSDAGKGYPFPKYDIEISDNFTKVHGRHTFKFGVDETGYKNYTRQGGEALTGTTVIPLGSFNFTGQWTGNKGWPGQPNSQGNAFADFLLGLPSATNFAGPQTDYQVTTRNWEFYGQDTFQVTSKLTLNYGVRYVYEAPWAVRDYRASYLDLKNNKLAIPADSNTIPNSPLAIPSLLAAYPFETTQQAGWPKSYSIPDKNNFGPRFGFAYRPFSGSKTVIRGGWGVYYDFYRSNASNYIDIFNPPWRTGSTWSSALPGKPTAPFLPDLTFDNPFPSAAQSRAPSNPLIYMTGRNNVNPVTQQWNFTVEQQLGNNWMVRGSYIGAQTHHALYTREDINRPNVQVPNVPLQAQRPYQPWGEIDNTYTGAKVNFNQLQLEVNKRLSSGLLVQAEYSYTRSLDNVPVVGGAQNPNNNNGDYGNSDSVPLQVLAVNYVYDIPVGNGRTFHLPNKALDAVAGGWSVSGITAYRTGAPLSVSFTVPSNIIGWWGGRPDAVAGGSIYAGQSSSHEVINGVQWFNPDAFIAPQPWQWGNAQRNDVFGPGSWNWDIGVQKSFAITERHRVQLRSDFLDAFNHFNLGSPSSTIADTRDGGLPNA
ncbi:MAG TPA: TonB-dependent receptor, partial [Bryobacteraceae bacterium]|nr:TonB-dependent receptor [Bryobacteraceae bacterium]